ncbi:MAG: putative DNA binding domain-containing protein [Synergistales bacterium]|nr:putative DNA binding domain-containing protein [Synergistales bacterium]
MNIKEIKQLVRGGESDTVEFKQSAGQLQRALKTLCGMLNRQGGQILFGVTPKGDIVGQQIGDRTLRDIAEKLHTIEPPAETEIKRVPVTEEKEVLVLSIPPQPELRPFVCDGRPYQRSTSTTSIMPQSVYQQLLRERMQQEIRWENGISRGYRVADLDDEEILRTVRLGREAGRLPESVGNDISDILPRLGLQVEEGLNNAAVVLFGNRFLPDYPQCHLRMARFRGMDKTNFIDQRQLEGHAFELLNEAMAFLRRSLPVAGRIVPGIFEREDEPLFPLEALREALVNAFCHRDYAIVGGAVSLAIYDDRLEIWSDGTLPFGLVPGDLKREHSSRLRNPMIAKTFYLRGIIEQWGRGTQKIVQLCVKAGHPEPEFGEQAGSVWVRFLPSGYIAPHRVAHDLTPRQRQILQMLSQSPCLAFRHIVECIDDPPPERTLREDLFHLKRLGLIETKGHGRGAVWCVSGESGRSKE